MKYLEVLENATDVFEGENIYAYINNFSRNTSAEIDYLIDLFNETPNLEIYLYFKESDTFNSRELLVMVKFDNTYIIFTNLSINAERTSRIYEMKKLCQYLYSSNHPIYFNKSDKKIDDISSITTEELFNRLLKNDSLNNKEELESFLIYNTLI